MSVVERAADAVEAARAAFADADALATVTQQEVVDLLALTAELTRIVGAQQVRLAGEIAERSKGGDEGSICRMLGSGQPHGALASAFGIRSGEAGQLLALAAATRQTISMTGETIAVRYPRVAKALDAGELSLAQAKVIVSTLEPAAPRADLDQLARAEGWLVHSATDPEAPLVPELLATQARAFAAVLDPDGVLPNEQQLRDQRGVRSWVLPSGAKKYLIVTPPEDVACFDAALDAFTSPRVRFVDAASGAVGPGEDPSGADDVVDDRTRAQKQFDALIGMVKAQVASGGTPTAGGEVPRLVLTGTIEAFDAYVRGVEHPDRTLTAEHTGGLVPIETADRILCDGVVQRAVVDPKGHVLALGREQRTFTTAQRRALAAHYRGCAVRGCRVPVAWTEAHHAVWWSHGGPTDTENGILLCSHHHHEVHAGRLVVVGSKGDWRVVPALQPRHRYARNPRTGHTLRPATTSTMPALPAMPDVLAAAGFGSCAHAAPPSLAVLIPDSAPIPRSEPVLPSKPTPRSLVGPRPAPLLAPIVRALHRGTSPVEHRLRQRMPHRHRSGPPRAVVDRHPPPGIVLRT